MIRVKVRAGVGVSIRVRIRFRFRVMVMASLFRECKASWDTWLPDPSKTTQTGGVNYQAHWC